MKLSLLLLILAPLLPAQDLPYPIVDTGQIRFYSDKTEIAAPQRGGKWFGQDASYTGNKAIYENNGDGTVSDLVTGLMWTQDPGKKLTLKQAGKAVGECRTGGHRDWRLPTIKELYSLINFSGIDPDPQAQNSKALKPFIDSNVFKFRYGESKRGERIIDSQYGSSTKYGRTTMGGNPTLFGVNFADGRIKGYPIRSPRGEKTFFWLYVRGNPKYGKNDFKDNGDGTVTDRATGLMWMKVDSGKLKAGGKNDGKLNWQEALAWAESLNYAGHTDWRLPNAKELQSLVDYTRSPAVTKSPAISPLFTLTPIKDEAGKRNYGFYWTSSTHRKLNSADAADYIAFGTALGWWRDRRRGQEAWMDVHGAGAQRSDPKTGDPSRFPNGRGPQGDAIRIYNFVLCCRGGAAKINTSGPKVSMAYRADQGGQGNRREGRPTGPEAHFKRLDRDGDGAVSKEEFDGPPEHFKHFDKNGDGKIDASEAAQGPPPRR